jgi:DsbC/DsbD-like thiol-disulfide interchange protein
MSARHVLAAILMVFLLGWAVCPVMALEEDEPKVRARLVTDSAEIEPGSTFRVGVRFEIEDGWHIYWRYPGGAGLATAVEFELPEGFTAGPLLWPLPIAFDQGEGIPGYGYEDSVVLAAEVEAPAEFNRSAPRSVSAEVSWLACKGVCVLGSAKLESSLAQITVEEGFAMWSLSLPAPLDEDNAPFALSTTGGLAGGTVTHWLRWREAPHPVEWFPDPSEALEVGDVQVQTRGGLTRVDAEISRRKGAKGSIDELPSLVVITDGDGTRRGWELSVDVTN